VFGIPGLEIILTSWFKTATLPHKLTTGHWPYRDPIHRIDITRDIEKRTSDSRRISSSDERSDVLTPPAWLSVTPEGPEVGQGVPETMTPEPRTVRLFIPPTER